MKLRPKSMVVLQTNANNDSNEHVSTKLCTGTSASPKTLAKFTRSQTKQCNFTTHTNTQQGTTRTHTHITHTKPDNQHPYIIPKQYRTRIHDHTSFCICTGVIIQTGGGWWGSLLASETLFKASLNWEIDNTIGQNQTPNMSPVPLGYHTNTIINQTLIPHPYTRTTSYHTKSSGKFERFAQHMQKWLSTMYTRSHTYIWHLSNKTYA